LQKPQNSLRRTQRTNSLIHSTSVKLKSLKEKNLALLESANFTKLLIQNSLKEDKSEKDLELEEVIEETKEVTEIKENKNNKIDSLEREIKTSDFQRFIPRGNNHSPVLEKIAEAPKRIVNLEKNIPPVKGSDKKNYEEKGNGYGLSSKGEEVKGKYDGPNQSVNVYDADNSPDRINSENSKRNFPSQLREVGQVESDLQRNQENFKDYEIIKSPDKIDRKKYEPNQFR